jgi:hypothetical protein
MKKTLKLKTSGIFDILLNIKLVNAVPLAIAQESRYFEACHKAL